MSMELILGVGTIFAIIYYFLEYNISKITFIFKNRMYEKENIEIYLKTLLLRGYHSSGSVISGRFIIESMLEKGKKIVLKKYYFWERYGLEMYIPLINDSVRDKIEEFVKREGMGFDVWKELRREFDGEVVGIDIRDDIEKGLRILEFTIELVLKKENEVGKLKMFFRELTPYREFYSFDIEKYEKDNEKIKKIEKSVMIADYIARIFNAKK